MKLLTLIFTIFLINLINCYDITLTNKSGEKVAARIERKVDDCQRAIVVDNTDLTNINPNEIRKAGLTETPADCKHTPYEIKQINIQPVSNTSKNVATYIPTGTQSGNWIILPNFQVKNIDNYEPKGFEGSFYNWNGLNYNHNSYIYNKTDKDLNIYFEGTGKEYKPVLGKQIPTGNTVGVQHGKFEPLPKYKYTRFFAPNLTAIKVCNAQKQCKSTSFNNLDLEKIKGIAAFTINQDLSVTMENILS